MSKTRKYAIWALCLYFATGLTTGLHGSVLCIAPNEGAKVEAFCQTSCGDPETSCDVEQPGFEAEAHPHCTGCSDIPLNYDSLLRRRGFVSHLTDDSSSLSLAQVTLAEVVDLTVTRVISRPTRAPSTSHLSSISTTILIC